MTNDEFHQSVLVILQMTRSNRWRMSRGSWIRVWWRRTSRRFLAFDLQPQSAGQESAMRILFLVFRCAAVVGVLLKPAGVRASF